MRACAGAEPQADTPKGRRTGAEARERAAVLLGARAPRRRGYIGERRRREAAHRATYSLACKAWCKVCNLVRQRPLFSLRLREERATGLRWSGCTHVHGSVSCAFECVRAHVYYYTSCCSKI